jgi:hypothetical protein
LWFGTQQRLDLFPVWKYVKTFNIGLRSVTLTAPAGADNLTSRREALPARILELF